MDELGAILREARETRGLTLAEVQEKIRINARFLEALEQAQYHELPTAVHIRGYLRNYAHFLGLDPQPLLARYEQSRNGRSQPVSPNAGQAAAADGVLSTRDDQPFFNPVNVQLGGDQSSASDTIMRWAIIVALIVALFLIVNRFYPLLTGQGDGSAALTEGLTEAVNQIMTGGDVASPADSAVEMGAGGDPLLATESITSTARNAIEVGPLPTPTATRPPLPATMEIIQLRVEVTERTWLQVTVDGEVAHEGLARSGDSFEWEARQSARILTGNAIGVFVTINGVQLGRLGSRGQVVDETWTTTN